MSGRFHWVYAIGAMASEYEVEAIKVGITSGFSGAPNARMRSLQTGNHRQLAILSVETYPRRIDASAVESAFHQNFKYARMTGEWFRPTDQVVSWVRKLGSLDHFYVDDLDRNCMRFWQEPDSGHFVDEDGNCPCDYRPQTWRVAS